MIRVKNNRRERGSALFHYAHFICDCLFPEIINGVYKYDEVVRMKNLNQTIGNFSGMYGDVMGSVNKELPKDEFNKLNVGTISYRNKNIYSNRKDFDVFRDFIFSRYKINPLEYDGNYPEIILVKRGGRINLIDDETLSSMTKNVTTGKERREIKNIEKLESYLNDRFGDKFKSMYFESIPFQDQVGIFNNAKLIVCAHGAVMSNMFFCKEGTTVIEVKCCGKVWGFFDTISKILKLNHLKCKNNVEDIIKCICEISLINDV